MDWCKNSWMVGDWGWAMINWCDMHWCWMRSGMSSVLDISNVSAISTINVIIDSLQSTIREQNVVFALSVVSITIFMMSEICSMVIIMNGIFVVVVDRNLFVHNGSVAMRGGMRKKAVWSALDAGK